MPVMDGLDAARVLKRVMPSLPLLIMYGVFAGRFSEQRARLIGINELVSKSEASLCWPRHLRAQERDLRAERS